MKPPAHAHSPLVAVDEATVESGRTVLLSPVSAVVHPGEALAVVGRNGTGKTTLLSLLCGLRKPSAGTVHVAGRSPDERSPAFRRTLAGMIGLPPFARDLTIREQLRLVAVSWGASATGGESPGSLADHWLERVDIGHLAGRFPHELSAGQLQLAGLALTLIRPSELLLLDEPEQRLDTGRRGLIADLLGALRDEGRTLIVSTHSDEMVRTVGTKILELGSPTS